MKAPQISRTVSAEVMKCPACDRAVMAEYVIEVVLGPIGQPTADRKTVQVVASGSPKGMTIEHDCTGRATPEPS